MTEVILVPPSAGVLGAPTLPADPKQMTPSESLTLKAAFETMLVDDPRCVGLARYVANLRIFWSYSIPTACAGHGFIFFNPDFYDSIPPESRITVMVHEVWHLILKHLDRSKVCDPYVHNEAADHVINNSLERDGFTFEGTDPCKDPQYANMSTEQVYNVLYAAKQKNPNPNKEQMDRLIPAELIEELIKEVLKEDQGNQTLEDQKTKAEEIIDKYLATAGKDLGNKPIVLNDTKKQIIITGASYHKIFEKYLTDPLSGGKRTFMRPNRRQHAMTGGPNALRLPGRYPKRGHKNRLTHLVYALDVSGSINDKQAQQFHNSVRTIKEILNPTKLTVIFFDTRIVLEKTFTDSEPYGTIRVTAGGGTSLTDVYRRTAEIKPEALVIFTDLCVTIPSKPEWECIWFLPEMRHNLPTNLYGKVYLIPAHIK